ncbi:MAG: saccharopine dehydrogenase family protein [Alphaproteobacteria bacterium]
MGGKILIYGATGFTGGLIADHASASGLRPILAARNSSKLSALAGRLHLEGRIFSLHDPHNIDEALADIDVVLHVAGPFSVTSKPMLDACMRTKTHYLDITGEIDVIEACAARDAEGRAAGITVVPAVGFDVVPSDCLAAHIVSRSPNAARLTLAIALQTKPSQGTLKTGLENVASGAYVRRNGSIVELTDPVRRDIDFGDGNRPTVSISWGDVATAFYSTKVPEITVLFEETRALKAIARMGPVLRRLLSATPLQSAMRWLIDRGPAGPNQLERESGHARIVAEVCDVEGNVIRSRLETPEPYLLTAQTSVAAATMVSDGLVAPGFHTPSQAFGRDFIMEFAGTSRVDE